MRYGDYYMMGEPMGEGYPASGIEQAFSIEGNTYERNMYNTVQHYIRQYNIKNKTNISESIAFSLMDSYTFPTEQKYHNLLTAKNLYPSEVREGVLEITQTGFNAGLDLYKSTGSMDQNKMKEAAEKKWQRILQREGPIGMAIFKIEQEAKEKAQAQDEMLEDKVKDRLDAAKMNVPNGKSNGKNGIVKNGNSKAKTEGEKRLFGLSRRVAFAAISLVGLVVIGSTVLLLMKD